MEFNKFTPHHVLIRAVENRPVFSDYQDCSRFTYQLYAVNFGRPALNVYRKDIVSIADKLLSGNSNSFLIKNSGPLVDILSFNLVKDHVHLILSPNIEEGIPKYIHKLNVSFAKYYNLKYKRQGVLFDKPYKSVPLADTSQLCDLVRYINVKNALDIYNPDWEKGVENWQEAFDFIENYKYSSYLDLFGGRRSKIIAPRSILEKYLSYGISKDRIKNLDFIENYINKKMENNRPIFLEK